MITAIIDLMMRRVVMKLKIKRKTMIAVVFEVKTRTTTMALCVLKPKTMLTTIICIVSGDAHQQFAYVCWCNLQTSFVSVCAHWSPELRFVALCTQLLSRGLCLRSVCDGINTMCLCLGCWMVLCHFYRLSLWHASTLCSCWGIVIMIRLKLVYSFMC